MADAAPNRDATCAARAKSISTICVSLTPVRAAYFAAWRPPRRPAPTTAARRSLMSVHRDIGGLRHPEGALALEQQAFSRFDAEHRCADLAHQFDRRGTDGGAIEAQ